MPSRKRKHRNNTVQYFDRNVSLWPPSRPGQNPPSVVPASKRRKLNLNKELKVIDLTTEEIIDFENEDFSPNEESEEEEYHESSFDPGEDSGIILVTSRGRLDQDKLKDYIIPFCSNFQITMVENADTGIANRALLHFNRDDAGVVKRKTQKHPAPFPADFTLQPADILATEMYSFFIPKQFHRSLCEVSDDIFEHFRRSRRGNAEQDNIRLNLDEIHTCVGAIFPRGSNAVVYGSAAYDIDSAGSDIDIGIKVPGKDGSSLSKNEQRKMLRKFMQRIKNCSWNDRNGQRRTYRITAILHAKVPILTVKDPTSELEMDISIYRSQVEISAWMKRLMQYDDRASKFLIAVKFWAKQRGIKDAKNQFLNSFGWVLLAIKYLQVVYPPVLPALPIHGHLQKRFQKQNVMSLGYLLYGFFKFYSNFDFDKHEITLHQQKIIVKREQLWKQERNRGHLLIIEDPIERNNNVARAVTERRLEVIQEELRNAAENVLQGWNQLCNAYDKNGGNSW